MRDQCGRMLAVKTIPIGCTTETGVIRIFKFKAERKLALTKPTTLTARIILIVWSHESNCSNCNQCIRGYNREWCCLASLGQYEKFYRQSADCGPSECFPRFYPINLTTNRPVPINTTSREIMKNEKSVLLRMRISPRFSGSDYLASKALYWV